MAERHALRSAAAIIAGVRPSTSSGGAQSARITFWSRWAESSEVSAMCSSGERRPMAMSARPVANDARRQVRRGRAAPFDVRTTTA